MSPTLILGLLLAISVSGNALLSKIYIGAKQEVARVQQAYDSFKAQVKVEGEEAQKKAAATKAAQDNATKEVAANAKKDRDRLTLYYERRLLNAASNSASGGSVSPDPVNPVSPDAAPAEPVASGPGFELACARDAQQVMQIQAWALKQGIPITP